MKNCEPDLPRQRIRVVRVRTTYRWCSVRDVSNLLSSQRKTHPARVGHGEQARLGVLVVEVLVVKLGAVDRLAASTVATGDCARVNSRMARQREERTVAALEHEAGDDAMEDAALVRKVLLAVLRLARLALRAV